MVTNNCADLAAVDWDYVVADEVCDVPLLDVQVFWAGGTNFIFSSCYGIFYVTCAVGPQAEKP